MKRAAMLTSLMALWIFAAVSAQANEEGEGIASRRGNPSPTASYSNIDEYTYQDEQVNLGPDDEDVLVLRANQKNLLNRYVTRAIPLRHVTPLEIRNVFRELTGKEGGRAEIIRDKVKKENFLQVVCPEWQLPYIEKAVAALDEKWVEENNDGSDAVYYKAKHRDIEDIDDIADFWGGEGFTAIDYENNAALRSDEPYRIKSYLKGAALVDVPEHQAKFDVKIYEVNSGADTDLGVDFIAWKNGPGRNLFRFGASGYEGEFRSGLTDTITARSRAKFASVNYLVTAAFVDFLACKGKAKTLASGSVQIKSGKTGSFGSMQPVMAFEVTPDDPGPSGTAPTIVDEEIDNDAKEVIDDAIFDRELNYRPTGEVGVSVEISPVVLTESAEADITVTVSNVEGYTPQGTPIISVAYTSTSARMADGSTLVLSGLTRDGKVSGKQGIPLLSSIPVLGYVFGGETNTNRQKQIVVVLEMDSETQGESHLANPGEIDAIAEQVDGAIEVPENSFGFDQWLLGTSSGAEI